MVARGKVFWFIMVGLLIVPGCGARQLTKSGAREALLKTPGIELKKKDVEIIEIQDVSGIGKHAVAKARIQTALKYEQVGNRWVLKEIRFGDRHWESIELLQKALDQERAERARLLLDQIAAALERYRQAHGQYPNAPTYEALIDQLSPQYLPEVIRLDPWARPFRYYYLSPQSYQLLSTGPDGKENTSDDIVKSVRR